MCYVSCLVMVILNLLEDQNFARVVVYCVKCLVVVWLSALEERHIKVCGKQCIFR
jgi:hypothetical protein